MPISFGKRTWVIPAVLLLAGGAVVLLQWAPWQPTEPPTDPPPGKAGDHVAGILGDSQNSLTFDLGPKRRESLAAAVKSYKPKTQGRIDDLDAPISAMLSGLPCVTHVGMTPASAKRSKRLIHFLNWHYVDRQRLAVDLGKPLADDDWERFLQSVESVQLEQAVALACLCQHHGLKRVYLEGLTAADMADLPGRFAAVSEAAPHQADLRKQLAELRAVLDVAEPGSAKFKKAADLAKEVRGLLDAHRMEVLKLGAAGQLRLNGLLAEVLPLDDADLLAAAGPDKRGAIDADAAARRERAMVKNAFSAGPVAIIVWGGSHDLTAAIRAMGADAEYVRVTQETYGRLIKEKPFR
jgi:hypothetical protein